MEDMQARVNGFKVESFMSKKDKIKLVLVVDKDEFQSNCSCDNISDMLYYLELHQSSEEPIELRLGVTSSSNEK